MIGGTFRSFRASTTKCASITSPCKHSLNASISWRALHCHRLLSTRGVPILINRTNEPRRCRAAPLGDVRCQTTLTNTSLSDARSAAAATYKRPKTGILARVPSSWVPYAELSRLDKPAGAIYLFFPCLFSTLLAAPLSPVAAASPMTVLTTSALFLSGALIMRGAGCTVNDLWDRNLDPYVTRTRLRPIARGAVKPINALLWAGVQSLFGLGILLQFPTSCLWHGIPSLLLVGTYPLAKRVTNYPQVVLGLAFSWGAMMGFPALGLDILGDPNVLAAAACLYTSCISWTVLYDMIYACMDMKDDKIAGIKSIALRHQNEAKTVLSSLGVLQICLLTSAGYCTGSGPIFYIVSCLGGCATLTNMIWRVRLGNVESCWWWFRQGCWITGSVIAGGLGLDWWIGKHEAARETHNPKVRA